MLCGSRAASASTSASLRHVVRRGDHGVRGRCRGRSGARGTVRSGAPAQVGTPGAPAPRPVPSSASWRRRPCCATSTAWCGCHTSRSPGSPEAIAAPPGRRAPSAVRHEQLGRARSRTRSTRSPRSASPPPATSSRRRWPAADLVAPGERVLVVGGAGRRTRHSRPGAPMPVRQRRRCRPARSMPSSSASTATSTTRSCAGRATAVLGRRPVDRDERRPDVPDARRADPRRRLAPRRGRHRRAAWSRRSRASRTSRWRATVLARLGHPDPATLVMVGDRWSTDGRFAVALGCPFALVRSGVTAPGARASRPRRRSTTPTSPRSRRRSRRALADGSPAPSPGPTTAGSASMASKNLLQQLIESGLQFGEMSRKQAESIVKQPREGGRGPPLGGRGDRAEHHRARPGDDAEAGRERCSTRSPASSAGSPTASTTSRISWRRSCRGSPAAAIAAQPRRGRGQEGRRGKKAAAKKTAAKKAPGEEGTTAEEGRGQEGHGEEGTRAKKTAAPEGTGRRRSRRRPLGRAPGDDDPQRLSRVGARRRLDAELVRRGLAHEPRARPPTPSPPDASSSTGAVAEKAARLVAPGDAVTVHRPAAAVRRPRRREARRRARRASASTSPGSAGSTSARRPAGSPTACSRRGAAAVVALDVGHGQLHPRIRADPRVPVLERTNVRTATSDDDRRSGRRRRRRRVVHLAAGDHPALVTPVPAWGADGAARQAAVRGRPRRGRSRAGRHHRPGRSTTGSVTRSTPLSSAADVHGPRLDGLADPRRAGQP